MDGEQKVAQTLAAAESLRFDTGTSARYQSLMVAPFRSSAHFLREVVK